EGDEATGWKPGKPTVFLATPFFEQEPMFSPDGLWIAYQSNEAGRTEIYVRPFPGPGPRWQISMDGGFTPTWSPTRHELLYRTQDNHIMRASYTADGSSFKSDKPRVWANLTIQTQLRQRWFDLHPDGERFAVSMSPAKNPTDAARDKVIFIFNFFDELRRIAPVAKK